MNYYYNPDRWMIIKIGGDIPHYKLFGSWIGGYVQGDSWRMNSGIVDVIEEDDYYGFIGKSGTTYACYKDNYGATSYGLQVAQEYHKKLGDNFVILDEVDAGLVIEKGDWIIS